MQYVQFVTDKKPWCVWDWDIKDLTTTFLETFDATYFDYLVTMHEGQLDGDNAKHAATAIRTTYLHAMETLFALLGAVVQAPDCVPGWMQKYRLEDLREVVKNITRGEEFLNRIRGCRLTWATLVQFTMKDFSIEDKEKEERVKRGFERLWTGLAHEFLREHNRAEYNSIKHGLRVSSGGSTVLLLGEETPGIAGPAEQMKIVGGSEHGSSFYEPAELKQRNIRLKRQSVNWDPKRLAHRVQLIAMSLNNIICFLKLHHGTAESVAFMEPEDLNAFDEVWINPSVSESSFFTKITIEDINPKTNAEILAVYNKTHPEPPESTSETDTTSLN